MPHLNGLDTASILSPLMPEVPTILFSAFDTAIRHSDAKAYGIRRLLCQKQKVLTGLYMCLRFQKAAIRGNYETGNQAFSMRLRFLTIRGIEWQPFLKANRRFRLTT